MGVREWALNFEGQCGFKLGEDREECCNGREKLV